MADLFLEWSGDFALDSKGGLLLVSGDDMTRQRLERRLFTAVNGYVWHKDYGAGLPQKIGDTFSISQVRSVVTSQVALEDSVAPNPPVQVAVTQNLGNPGQYNIAIQYWSAKSGRSVSFEVGS